MTSFLAKLIALAVVFHGDAYRVGNQDLQVDITLERAVASGTSARGKISEATDRRMMMAMWEDIVEALRHSVTGAEQAVEFGLSTNARYAEIDSMISENNLGTIIGADFSIADMKSIANGQMILTVNGLLTTFFHEITLLLDTSSSLLNTMSTAVELTQEVPEFSPAATEMATHDFSSWQSVASSLNISYFEESACQQIGETLDPLLSGWQELSAWGQARRAARGGVPLQSSLKNVSEIWSRLGAVHQAGELQVLLNNTLRVARSMLEATHNVGDLPDRPFGATEVIDSNLCEPEPTHNFFITRPVDDDTMSCVEYSYIARKTCRCRNPTDCYVTSDNRPPPQNVKRCFRPMARARESIDRAHCAPEVSHNFRSSETVDDSMDCDVGFFVQSCTCKFPQDCYVHTEHRPEPSDVKRCFRPTNGTTASD